VSAYSTLRITRTKAKAYVLETLLNLSDEQLEGYLDAALEPRLYNSRIVSDDDQDNDNERL
jgi:hypothetical protein